MLDGAGAIVSVGTEIAVGAGATRAGVKVIDGGKNGVADGPGLKTAGVVACDDLAGNVHPATSATVKSAIMMLMCKIRRSLTIKDTNKKKLS